MAKKQRDEKAQAQPESSRARTRRTAKPSPAREGNAAWEWAKSGLIAFVLFLVMRTFLVQTFVITSGSMENTLLVGDYLIVNRAAIGSRIPFTGLRIPGYSEPHRGDVLVFDPPHEQDLKLVKRLIGMPGDTLAMRDKRLYRNGDPQDEPYVQHVDQGDERHPWMEWQRDFLVSSVDRTEYEPTRDNWGPIVIPEGNYFMLGDNRDTSLDSRYWGLLEAWRLEGRASRIYYSYDKQSLKPFRFFRDVRADRIGDPIR
jgi:signal peptidase I